MKYTRQNHTEEEIEKLLDSIDPQYGIPGRLSKMAREMLEDLAQENKRLREALEFYANTEHIDLPTEGIDDGSGILYFQVEGINVENGIKARKALEGK